MVMGMDVGGRFYFPKTIFKIIIIYLFLLFLSLDLCFIYFVIIIKYMNTTTVFVINQFIWIIYYIRLI